MTSADVKFSIDQTTARRPRAGATSTRPSSRSTRPSPDHRRDPPQVPVGAAARRPVAVRQRRSCPNNYGGKTETAVLQRPGRHRPVQVGLLAQGQALKLVRNPNYWEKGKPYLNSVTWTDVPSDNTRELQLKGGQAQIDEFPAWSTVASLKTTPGVTMNLFNSTQTDYLAFNEKRKPFQDVHVRRAISLAIDRNALVKAVLFGNGKPANSLFPPQVPYYQAGHPGPPVQPGRGQGRRWPSPACRTASPPRSWSPSGNSDYLTIATILQSELKPLGINLKIQPARPEHGEHEPAEPQVRHDADATGRWTSPTRTSSPPSRSTRSRAPSRSSPPTTTPPWSRPRTTAEQTLSDPAAAARSTTRSSPTSASDAFMAFLYYSPVPLRHHDQRARLLRHAARQHHMENVWLSK